jgi:hypothetical protein
LAVGGNALAFTLGKNSVGSKQLKKNAVTTAKIKKEAVTAVKVKKGTLTGKQINASTLGTVPNAVNAQSLGGLSADQIQKKLRCPSGTVPISSVCIETAARQVAGFIDALEICASVNRSLPSVGELATYLLTQQTELTSNWAGSQYFDPEAAAFFAPHVQSTKGITLGVAAISSSTAFRCVTGPAN